MADYISRLDTLTPSNKEFVKAIASKKDDNFDKEKAKAKKKEYLKAMADGDKEKQKAYAAGLVENTNYTIEAQMIFTDFLNRGTMEADQRTWFYTLDEPITDNKARIYTISNHGNAPIQDIIQSRDTVWIRPYWITTEEVSMSKFNLRMGDISNESKMRKRASNALAKDTEVDAKSLLSNGLIDDISAVNGIEIDDDVSEYPTQTDFDLSSEGGITMEVMKNILKHFMLLGKSVRNIYVPATRMTDLWDWMSMPAGYDDSSGVDADTVVPAPLHDQIVRTGTVNNLFGYPVNLIPVNSLNGDTSNGDVYVWVSTNEGAGEYRVFPEPISSTYSHEDAQRLYYSIQRAVAMFQTPPQRLNYARFKIDTA